MTPRQNQPKSLEQRFNYRFDKNFCQIVFVQSFEIGYPKIDTNWLSKFYFQIWDVSSESRLYAPLRLHQSWVTDIQFCKDNVHMVTVGDKIAWWNLDHLPRSRANTRNRRASVSIDPFKRRRRSSTSDSSPGGCHF